MSSLNAQLETPEEDGLVFSPASEAEWILVHFCDTPKAHGTNAHLQSQPEEDMAQATQIRRDPKGPNANNPFLSLPSDAMTNIVLLVADVKPARRFRLNVSRPTLGWIKFTHVCHDLREFVLSLPSLWAKHVFHFPAAYQTLLERAQSAALSASIDLLHDDAETTARISSHAGRLRSLKITVPRGETRLEEWWEGLAGQTLSSLKALALERQDHDPKTATTLSLTAPNLQTMRCRNAIVLCASPNLRSLSISTGSRHFVDASFLPTPEEFLSLLTASPNLEELFLSQFFPDMSPVLIHGKHRLIPLLRLLKLKIENNLVRVSALLECLDIPRVGMDILISVDESDRPGNADTTDIDSIASFLHALAAGLCGIDDSRRPIRHVSYADDYASAYPLSFTVCLDGDEEPVETAETASRPHTAKVRFGCRALAMINDKYAIFEVVASTFSFEDTKSVKFHLGKHSVYSSQEWENMLGHFKAARTLHITSPFKSLISALNGSLSPSKTSSLVASPSRAPVPPPRVDGTDIGR